MCQSRHSSKPNLGMLGHSNQPSSTKAALATTNIKMRHDLLQLPLHYKGGSPRTILPGVLGYLPAHGPTIAYLLRSCPVGRGDLCELTGEIDWKEKHEKDVGAHVHVLQQGWTPLDGWPRVKLRASRSKRSKQSKNLKFQRNTSGINLLLLLFFCLNN